MDICVKQLCILLMEIFIHTSALELNIHLSKLMIPGSDVINGTYVTLSVTFLQDCIEHCKLRKGCKFVNYEVSKRLCAINSYRGNNSYSVYNDTRSGFVSGEKAEWNMTGYTDCDVCTKDQSCVRHPNSTTSCQITDCGVPPLVLLSETFGNMLTTGSKVTYNCTGSGASEYNATNTITCLPDGTWHGPNISCDVDDCNPNPCYNGAYCVDGMHTYTCMCVDGYVGYNCETDVDDCNPTPCYNGGTCLDGVNTYNCTCAAGYEGNNCETNVDDCNPTPCNNGGTCLDGVNTYTCTCVAGYVGLNCETNVDDCYPTPCYNGGTCLDGVNTYNCTCVAGYEGLNCETNVDDCNPTPCYNGGTCMDGVNTYNCTCVAGYEGNNCETDVDDCNPTPCYNGGTCLDGVNTYNCTCVAGYVGLNCETNVDDCNPTPCYNGGTCLDGVNTYTCTCVAGYEGNNCETISDGYTEATVSGTTFRYKIIAGTTKNQAGAFNICDQEGGTLFRPVTTAKMDFMRNLLSTTYNTNLNLDFWTDLKYDRSGDNEWRTSSLEYVSRSNDYWNSGHPNYESSQKCCRFNYRYNYYLENTYCNNQMAYICEK